MCLTAQILRPMARSLLQRAPCFSDLSTCSVPILQPQPTFQLFKNWSNFLRIVKFFALSPFCPFRLRNRNCHIYFSLLFPFFLVSSPHLVPSPHLFYHSHPESYCPSPHLLLPFAVHSPHLVLLATLTHFGVLIDWLRGTLYATLVVPHLGKWVGCGIQERWAQVSSLLLPEPHGEPQWECCG